MCSDCVVSFYDDDEDCFGHVRTSLVGVDDAIRIFIKRVVTFLDASPPCHAGSLAVSYVLFSNSLRQAQDGKVGLQHNISSAYPLPDCSVALTVNQITNKVSVSVAATGWNWLSPSNSSPDIPIDTNCCPRDNGCSN